MMHKGKEIRVSSGMSGNILWTGHFVTKVSEGEIKDERVAKNKGKLKCKGNRYTVNE